jgi:hypothetical protein
MFRVLGFKQTHQKNYQKSTRIKLKIVKTHKTKHTRSMSIFGLIELKIDMDINDKWIFIVNDGNWILTSKHSLLERKKEEKKGRRGRREREIERERERELKWEK